MSKMKHTNGHECPKAENEVKQESAQQEAVSESSNEQHDKADEDSSQSADDALQAKVKELEARVSELEEMKLRQMAEFDNYRRRTNKEKLELLETAGERILKEMLPLIDDFERAREAMQKSDDINSLREGVELIYSKFVRFLEANNVHVIETNGVEFSTDLHEAITTFAAGDDKKGKIIDCTQKGYKLGDKVIRFSKVVVGE